MEPDGVPLARLFPDASEIVFAVSTFNPNVPLPLTEFKVTSTDVPEAALTLRIEAVTPLTFAEKSFVARPETLSENVTVKTTLVAFVGDVAGVFNTTEVTVGTV